MKNRIMYLLITMDGVIVYRVASHWTIQHKVKAYRLTRARKERLNQIINYYPHEIRFNHYGFLRIQIFNHNILDTQKG